MAAPAPSRRLSFREFATGDLTSLAALLSDPEVMRYSWRGPLDLESSKGVLSGFQRVYREHGFGKWALHLRETGEFAGYCGLEPCPPGHPRDLSWATAWRRSSGGKDWLPRRPRPSCDTSSRRYK